MAWVDLELSLRRRSSLLWVAAGLLAAAVLVHQFATQPVAARIAERQLEHARILRGAARPEQQAEPARSEQEERLAAFTDALCERRELGTFVANVFEQAEKRGIVLAQGEYKLDYDKPGRFYVYQVTLPVRGPYPRLRGFVDATLAKIPCAALEDVDFKREAIGAPDTEARLRLVFFLRPEPS